MRTFAKRNCPLVNYPNETMSNSQVLRTKFLEPNPKCACWNLVLAIAGTLATDSRCSYTARLPCRIDPTRQRVVRRGKKRGYGRWATGPRRLVAERWLPRRASLGH